MNYRCHKHSERTDVSVPQSQRWVHLIWSQGGQQRKATCTAWHLFHWHWDAYAFSCSKLPYWEEEGEKRTLKMRKNPFRPKKTDIIDPGQICLSLPSAGTEVENKNVVAVFHNFLYTLSYERKYHGAKRSSLKGRIEEQQNIWSEEARLGRENEKKYSDREDGKRIEECSGSHRRKKIQSRREYTPQARISFLFGNLVVRYSGGTHGFSPHYLQNWIQAT